MADGIRLATEDAHGAGAGVRAVEAEAGAADELADVGLGDARVRADGAGCLAGAALVQASRKHGGVGDQRPRMRFEDLSDAHGLLLRWPSDLRAADDLAQATASLGHLGPRRSRPLPLCATGAARARREGCAW